MAKENIDTESRGKVFSTHAPTEELAAIRKVSEKKKRIKDTNCN